MAHERAASAVSEDLDEHGKVLVPCGETRGRLATSRPRHLVTSWTWFARRSRRSGTAYSGRALRSDVRLLLNTTGATAALSSMARKLGG